MVPFLHASIVSNMLLPHMCRFLGPFDCLALDNYFVINCVVTCAYLSLGKERLALDMPLAINYVVLGLPCQLKLCIFLWKSSIER